MSIITKTSAKQYFQTGDFPTQSQFADMIDSYVGLGETSAQNLATLNITTMLSATTANVTTFTATNAVINNTATIIGFMSASGGINTTTVSANSIYGTTIIPTNIVGTTTNNSATSGSVGEYISSTVNNNASGASSGNPANITSISLTAGDWDVWGVVVIGLAASSTGTLANGGISTTSATLPSSTGGALACFNGTIPPGANPSISLAITPIRISLNSTTIVYLVGQVTFAISTAGLSGFIGARRAR